MITHYLDLNVVTKGIHKEMRFLVTDIGQEEVLLGYPWCYMSMARSARRERGPGGG
jgi:hypothetical protein